MQRATLVGFASEQTPSDKPPQTGLIDRHILHFIHKGSGYFNGKLLTAGYGFLMQYADMYEYYPNPDDPWEYAWISFRDDEMLVTLKRLIDFDEQKVFKYDTSIEYFDVIKRASIELGLRRYHQANGSYMGTSLYYHLLALLNDDPYRKPLHSQNRPSLREKHVSDIKRLVSAGYAKPDFSVATVSENLHLSRAYMRNLFSMYESCSVQEYIIRVRIAHAKDFLLRTESPVGIIASSVGYTDQLQFSKIFKKYCGKSPKQYRDSLKESNREEI